MKLRHAEHIQERFALVYPDSRVEIVRHGDWQDDWQCEVRVTLITTDWRGQPVKRSKTFRGVPGHEVFRWADAVTSPHPID